MPYSAHAYHMISYHGRPVSRNLFGTNMKWTTVSEYRMHRTLRLCVFWLVDFINKKSGHLWRCINYQKTRLPKSDPWIISLSRDVAPDRDGKLKTKRIAKLVQCCDPIQLFIRTNFDAEKGSDMMCPDWCSSIPSTSGQINNRPEKKKHNINEIKWLTISFDEYNSRKQETQTGD